MTVYVLFCFLLVECKLYGEKLKLPESLEEQNIYIVLLPTLPQFDGIVRVMLESVKASC